MSFKKVDRSYKTPSGWRLATFQEVEYNINSIKQQDILKGRDRARLLDGWIGGPYYDHKIENTFNAFLDFMLVIKVHTQESDSSNNGEKELYDGINLSDEGKHVALFLCACDWNYEVVYWLLNSWDKTQTMDPRDVTDGKIPLNDSSIVNEMVRLNNLINDLARKFGETFVDHKTRNKKFTQSSIRYVLGEVGTSILAKFPVADEKFLHDTFQTCKEFYEKNHSLLEAQNSNWDLVWDHFCAFHVLFSTHTSLSLVINKLLQNKSPKVTTSQRNFILSTSILYYIIQVSLKFHEKFITITRDGDFNVLDEILNVAAGEGNVVIIKKTLDCGAHAFRQDLEKQTALHVAFKHIKNKDKLEEAVKILVDGCDAKEQLVNLPNEDGETVLHLASSKRSAEICRFLLDHRANPNAKDKRGLLPLHYAVEAGFNSPSKIRNMKTYINEALEVVKILLSKDITNKDLINLPYEDGKTVLHLASSKRSVEMCNLLLDYGANPNAEDKGGLLPLHYAVKGTVQGRFSIRFRGNLDETINEAITVVQSLLDRSDTKEQSVNLPYEDGKTLLHLASSKRSAEMCELLLDYGAKPDAKDKSGRLPMHSAVESIWSRLFERDIDEAIKVVNVYLDRCDEKKQLLNLPDDKGKTVLHLASSKGNAKMCRLLLDYGAKPDAKDKSGRLPLHYAVDDKAIDVLFNASNLESTKMLTSTDSNGKSPLEIAVDQNNIKLMEKFFVILEQPPELYFTKVNTSKLLRKYASEGNTDIVEKLLERGASPVDVDWEGKTALHHAALCQNHTQAARIILLIFSKCRDKKELISLCDKKGKTAVHVAALNGNILQEVFKDSIDIKDRDDRSPLHDATQGKEDDADIIKKIVDMMRRRDISQDDLIDTTGLTPLHMAASKGKVFQVDALLEQSRDSKKYVKRADYLGQTALHKAAKGGHHDTITVLLHWGAEPLLERDCDGRTALHYAVQAETGEGGIALAELLLKKCGSKETKLLFLCASAAGLGSADQNLSDCPLKRFLVGEMEKLSSETDNLLRAAARLGDTGTTKELLTRGYQITDIQQNEWMESLHGNEKKRVQKVLEEIKTIAEQGNDRPSLSDNLGRAEFARGLAALLLNPYLKPPIAIGISGNWGMGKSSLMVQTEITLLKTAAQAALLPTSQSPSSNLPGVKDLKLTKVGKKRYNEIQRWLRALKINESQGKQAEVVSPEKFLNNYEPRYHKIFKSLASIDSSDMFTPEAQQPHPRSDPPSEGNVPAIITVQYNAWKYRNESEAMAGMAVEITKEMEEIMTEPQWLSTCWRNTWRKQKQTIWIEVISPFLLATFLAGTFTWIVWLLLDRYNVKERVNLKYASLPATTVIMVWTLVKSVMGVVKPVSTQLMNYVKFPDHSEKLGYQERVISDIKFLKGEIRKKPYFVCTAVSSIWRLITTCCMVSLFCQRKSFRETTPNTILASSSTSYTSDNLRIIVFVDDLDRCQESVILQVLSAINLVLAVCEINAIVGMDKALIQKAIKKKHGDKSLKNSEKLADRYLQKIIQLPLDLPDPSEYEFEGFLKTQLGVFSKGSKDEDAEPETDADDNNSKSGIDAEYNALFSTENSEVADLGDRLKEMFSADTSLPDASASGEINAVTQMEGDSHPETDASDRVAIVVNNGHGANTENSGGPNLLKMKVKEIWPKLFKLPIKNIVDNCALRAVSDAVKALFVHKVKASLGSNTGKINRGDQSSIESIPIREMLFVRYSEGEQEAFFYFQKMATDWRRMPRQWKCLLYYHRLIWYIFSMSNEARTLNGWQLQLISWIFLCWEWEENMNILIQKWKRIDILNTYKAESISGSNGSSLRAIVDHYIENEDKYKKMSDTGNEKHKGRVSEKPKKEEIKPGNPKEERKERDVSKNNTEEMKAEKVKEDFKGKGICKSTEDPESGKSSEREVVQTGEMVTMPDFQGHVLKRTEIEATSELLELFKNKDNPSEKLEEGVKEKNLSNVVDEDVISNRVVEKLKLLVKDQMTAAESNNRAISEKLEKALMELDEVKKEIRDLKEAKQQSWEDKKYDEEEQTRLDNWLKMRAALEKYDVSMEGIQAFQRFRFYCVAGYLPWPLLKQKRDALR